MTADGILVIDKPERATSADVVRVVKRLLGGKVGHLGTLDPFATGVLPLCLGEGTKLAPFLNEADKEYEGVIQLGRSTDSGDLTGSTTSEAAIPILTADSINTVAAKFHGELLQTPPMHSALKRQGVPLYKLARQGIEVERLPRKIYLSALELRIADERRLRFRVSCSKGTYIRVLAEDVASALGTCGYLESLRRTRFGRFPIASAVPLNLLDASTMPLIGLCEALVTMPELSLDAEAVHRARGGYEPVLRALRAGSDGEHAKLVGPDGKLVAVVIADAMGHWRFARVFAPTTPPAAPPLH